MDPITSQAGGATLRQVLIVDQERFATLIGKMLSDAFVMTSALDGLQAIRQLLSTKPDLMIIEETIQGNGIRLAELIGMNPHFEHIPIVLISVRPSPDSIIRSRNAGINAYLAKPFRPSELRNRIDSIFAHQTPPELSMASTQTTPKEAPTTGAGKAIKDRIRQIEGLPPFPATHAQILELAQSDDASSEKIAELIQMDPSLLATVFKIVNSSAYGFPKKVDSLKLAVTMLGLEEIANLVMTAQVFKSLGNYQGAGLDRNTFWRHSVGTAFITRAIAKKFQTEIESAFLAGMLHDLGKIVLDRCFPDFYRSVLEQVQAEDQWIYDAERQILGLSHTDVGAQLSTEWKFSEKYFSSIQFHHDPLKTSRYHRLVGLVHIADIICRQLQFGSGGDNHIPEFNPDVLDRFSLGERGIQILKEAAEADLEGAESFLGALASG